MISALKKFISSCLVVGIIVCALAAFGGYKLREMISSESETPSVPAAPEAAPVVPAPDPQPAQASAVPAPTLDGERKKARARLMEIRVSVKTEMRRLEEKRRALGRARSGGANAERAETLAAEVASGERTLENLRKAEAETEAKIRELDARALRERENKPFST